MLMRNTLRWAGKNISFFLAPKEITGKFTPHFFSTTTKKATEVASSQLESKTSPSTQKLPSPHALSKDLSLPEHEARPPFIRDASWLRPLMEKGVIDAEAEKKFLASFEPDWVSEPKNFVQIDLDKATHSDLIDLFPVMSKGVIDPEVDEKITKILDDQMNADFAIEYANPELDRLIELNHGRIENIEDFDMFDLRHRATLGVLDAETTRKAHDRVYAYYEKTSQDLIDEGELTDYSAYFEPDLENDLLEDKPSKDLSLQENQTEPPFIRDASWLRPLMEKGVIDAEAEKKFLASFEPDWVSETKNFVQIDLDKATHSDLVDLFPVISKEVIDPEVDEKITQILDDKRKADLDLKYANPELDRLIELNHGRIENIEDFDMLELRHRANFGMLDAETTRKAYDRVDAYYEKMSQDLIDEGELTDYSAYLEEELENEQDLPEKK
ncbi:MAG: hypothetical protein QRY71_01555 [Candidatus Rhabdochlamydia sp.]